MKEHLAELVRQTATPTQGRNLAREYLQARILAALQRAGAMIPLAFHDGTALRFLYTHGRYSEDLDFALEGDRGSYDFRGYLQAIRAELTPEGYPVELKVSDQKTVHSAFVRFPGLLYELGLSGQQSEVLAVKIEVDTNPPAGAGVLRRRDIGNRPQRTVQIHHNLQGMSPRMHLLLFSLFLGQDGAVPEPRLDRRRDRAPQQALRYHLFFHTGR